MKKLDPLDPVVLRGRFAEERFFALARSLKSDLPWVRKVRPSGIKLDCAGVDASIYIAPLRGGGNIKVPVQVKSSFIGVITYREQHPECVLADVITIVVNEYRSDDDIRLELRKHLETIRANEKNFKAFYQGVAERSFQRVNKHPYSRIQRRAIVERALLEESLHGTPLFSRAGKE